MSLMQIVCGLAAVGGLLGLVTAWILEPPNYNFLFTWSFILLLLGALGFLVLL